MLRYFICIAISFVLMPVLLSAQENRPSFDCSKAQSDAENLVCSDSQLALLDRELSRVYTLAFQDSSLDAKGKKYLRASQRGWIKGRDEAWKVKDKKRYVRGVYLLRIAEILNEHPAARNKVQEGISSGPVEYDCEGTSAESYVILSEPAGTVLYFEKTPFVLIQEVSGSGVKYVGKYADGTAEFWTKGKEAQFTAVDGRKLHCFEKGH